jgi:peptidoglycan/LPS O-acetylase OafA/YrhL
MLEWPARASSLTSGDHVLAQALSLTDDLTEHNPVMRRLPELDAVRGLAALWIVGHHFTYPGPFYEAFFYTGWISLEFFFVLSGYLITTIVLENGGREGFFRTFYSRRALRIWPIYYLFLLAVLVVHRFVPGIGPIDGLPFYMTFTQNTELYVFRTPHPFLYVFDITWSLAIEEQFYILWPLLVILLTAGGRRSSRVTWLVALTVALSVTLRCLGFHEHLLLARADGFALGGLIAVLTCGTDHDHAPSRRWVAAWVVVALSGLVYLTLGHWLQGQRPLEHAGPLSFLAAAVVAFGVIGLVVTHSGHSWLRPLRGRGLGYVGTISYGIYLYHLACLVAASVILRRLGVSQTQTQLVAVALVLCVGVAVTSWTLIEEPILRLKRLLRYGKRPRPVPTAAEAVVSLPVADAEA